MEITRTAVRLMTHSKTKTTRAPRRGALVALVLMAILVGLAALVVLLADGCPKPQPPPAPADTHPVDVDQPGEAPQP